MSFQKNPFMESVKQNNNNQHKCVSFKGKMDSLVAILPVLGKSGVLSGENSEKRTAVFLPWGVIELSSFELSP